MKIHIFLFPMTLFIFFVFTKLSSPEIYALLIEEDSWIECAQAFIYFLSAILSAVVAVKFLMNRLAFHGILYVILAIGLLLVSIEEISWGQRMFSLPTPCYFEQHNIQKELSLHNLDTIQPLLHGFYIITGAFGAFSWLPVRLFLSRAKRMFHHLVEYVVPEWFISSYFFFVFFIYAFFEYCIEPHENGFLVWRDQEPAELLLSLGFLLFVMTNYVRLRTGLAAGSAQR